ncbi:hypothetical protein C922_05531 [Plasmodium inui San Antonio 1]|uniref:Uncharacterized protein n=1 Tax=Plasmodium inui San Antonio 1 TaxID=1237626 RepID=W7A4R8_9APIC|nr:hypothetical protein C922_05531 [Plasmodium inui San Antonio 1]EUD64089.1 hypothetical protein C922_05531 [Plasmodium inui San Antonio 1]
MTWDSIAAGASYRSTKGEHVTFSICIQIVTLVAKAFRIKGTGTDVEEETPGQEDECESLYSLLKAWGGEALGQKVMDQWFVGGDEVSSRSALFSLSGIDLFEMLTSLISQGRNASKGLTCERQSEGGADKEREGVSYRKGNLNEEHLGALRKMKLTLNSSPVGEGADLKDRVSQQGRLCHNRGEIQATGPTCPKVNSIDQQHQGFTDENSVEPNGGGRTETADGGEQWGKLLGSVVGGFIGLSLGLMSMYGLYRIVVAGNSKGRPHRTPRAPLLRGGLDRGGGGADNRRGVTYGALVGHGGRRDSE